MSEYISDIYVDGLRIISIKLNFEKSSVVTYFTVSWHTMTSQVGPIT